MVPFIAAIFIAIAVLGFGIASTLKNIADEHAASIAAVITNDSTSVDLDAPGSAYEGEVSTPSEIFNDEENTNQEENNGSGSSSSEPIASSPAIDVVTVTYSDPSSDASSDASSSESSGENEVEDASSLLSTLIGGQAVSLNPSVGSSEADGSGGGVSGLSLQVRGQAVREALSARGIKKISIPGFLSAEGLLIGRLRSKEDIALVVSAHTLSNENLEDIFFSFGTVSVTYRARGRLFAVIPLSYKVRLSVNPQGKSAAERIKVKFPWYKFFLQTYVSKNGLERELDAAVLRTLGESDASSLNTQAKLFSTVSQILSERFDTVEGSVQTGR